jgi:GPI-anchor transamidase subunit U
VLACRLVCPAPLLTAPPGAAAACTVDEGAYWLESGQSPYGPDARIVYQPPIVVFMHSALRAVPSPPGADGVWSILMLSLADVLAAAALRRLVLSSKETELTTARPTRGDTVAAVYLLNPQVVAACVGGSTAAYSNAATLLSLSLAAQGEQCY